MKDSDNPYLIQGKKTKKDQGPKKKMFGYRVLGFGGGSLPDEYIEQYCPFCGEEHEHIEEENIEYDEDWNE